MAKRTRIWNESKYRRYLKEGRGQGTMSSYKPWIMVQDFPSNGMVSRVKGAKTNRIHHLMSNNELCYFYLLDWSERTIDIREQFPLADLSCVIEIAEKAGIRYPYDNVSGFPYVLTSDFLITTPKGLLARTVKMTAELNDPRVLEKLEIERRYWRKRGIDWRIVTEKEINRQKAHNIEWLLQARNLEEFIPNKKIMKQSTEYFLELYDDLGISFNTILNKVETAFAFDSGIALSIFKYLVFCKKIKLDINTVINLNEPREMDATPFKA